MGQQIYRLLTTRPHSQNSAMKMSNCQRHPRQSIPSACKIRAKSDDCVACLSVFKCLPIMCIETYDSPPQSKKLTIASLWTSALIFVVARLTFSTEVGTPWKTLVKLIELQWEKTKMPGSHKVTSLLAWSLFNAIAARPWLCCFGHCVVRF